MAQVERKRHRSPEATRQRDFERTMVIVNSIGRLYKRTLSEIVIFSRLAAILVSTCGAVHEALIENS